MTQPLVHCSWAFMSHSFMHTFADQLLPAWKMLLVTFCQGLMAQKCYGKQVWLFHSHDPSAIAFAEMQSIHFRPEMSTDTCKCQESALELLFSLFYDAWTYTKMKDALKTALLLLATLPLHLAARDSEFSTAAEQTMGTRPRQAKSMSSTDRLGAAWAAVQLRSLKLSQSVTLLKLNETIGTHKKW